MKSCQFKRGPVYTKTFTNYGYWPGAFPEQPYGSVVIELGIALANAQSNPALPGTCSLCAAPRDPDFSSAQFPSVFCSEQCEQHFVQQALASFTLEDCMSMHNKLEKLVTSFHDNV